MNNENFEFLANNEKYMGFGKNLKEALEEKMSEGKLEFQLHFATELNKKPFEATLNFRKSESTDMYFFNNYRASPQCVSYPLPFDLKIIRQLQLVKLFATSLTVNWKKAMLEQSRVKELNDSAHDTNGNHTGSGLLKKKRKGRRSKDHKIR